MSQIINIPSNINIELSDLLVNFDDCTSLFKTILINNAVSTIHDIFSQSYTPQENAHSINKP